MTRKKLGLTLIGKVPIVHTHTHTLPTVFLLIFPISHKWWRRLYKRTLKFQKENVAVTLMSDYYYVAVPANIILLARGAMISLAASIFWQIQAKSWHVYNFSNGDNSQIDLSFWVF